VIVPARAPAALVTSAAGELAGVARRTRWLQLVLAGAAVALLGLALLLARGTDARATSYFARGGGGIVVFDLSTSVDRFKYQRLQRVLKALVGTETRVGLVFFSDTAYEALPPGTRSEELKALIRFFQPAPLARSVEEAEQSLRRFGIATPWSGTFRGGTRISTGLREARLIMERDGIRDPSVLLVSDLDDSAFDTTALTQELIRYERTGIDLRIVSLFPSEDDRDLFAQLVGEDAFVGRRELVRNTEIEERQTLVASFPTAFVIGAAALLGLLALNERVCARVAWRRRT
jgi:hypothetical protein